MKWIKVSEALPGSERVLVWSEDYPTQVMSLRRDCCKIYWVDEASEDSNESTLDEYTYWCPLPEDPE